MPIHQPTRKERRKLARDGCFPWFSSIVQPYTYHVKYHQHDNGHPYLNSRFVGHRIGSSWLLEDKESNTVDVAPRSFIGQDGPNQLDNLISDKLRRPAEVDVNANAAGMEWTVACEPDGSKISYKSVPWTEFLILDCACNDKVLMYRGHYPDAFDVFDEVEDAVTAANAIVERQDVLGWYEVGGASVSTDRRFVVHGTYGNMTWTSDAARAFTVIDTVARVSAAFGSKKACTDWAEQRAKFNHSTR